MDSWILNALMTVVLGSSFQVSLTLFLPSTYFLEAVEGIESMETKNTENYWILLIFNRKRESDF